MADLSASLIGRIGAVMIAAFATTVSMSEFLALRRMAPDAVRKRLGLPTSCDPQLTAAARPPGRIRVLVVCKRPAKAGGRGQGD